MRRCSAAGIARHSSCTSWNLIISGAPLLTVWLSPPSAVLPKLPLDINDAPFSRRGHWLSLSCAYEPTGCLIGMRTARGAVIHKTLLTVEILREGQSVPSELRVSPGSLLLVTEFGDIAFALTDTATLRIQTVQGVVLRVQMVDQPYSSSLQCEPGRWHLNLNASRTRLMITALSGELHGHAPFIAGKSDTEPARLDLSVAPGEQNAELEITEFESTWMRPAKRMTFNDICVTANRDFDAWFAAFGDFRAESCALARRAAFVLWANTVPAGGNYASPAVMMSRNALIGIWSWDHCFVALALARAHPEQAWEQWWLPFKLQTEEGMLPDAFTESYRDYAMTKPPVHGWALRTILKFYHPTEAELREAYGALERWTTWWLTHRDDDGDGIPQYNHGCESGWDNDSLCCGGLPCESPDLSVYLIQQQQMLATLARRLNNEADATRWDLAAHQLKERLIAHSWQGDRFIAPQSGSHAIGLQGNCLRKFWPLLLGKELPDAITSALLKELLVTGNFRTSHGFATESTSSSYYKSNGYWLGPIWAPSTYQVVEILDLHGLEDEATRAMRDFVQLCERNGFRENYDAVTGDGLCDRGFAWTAAVCLDFLRRLA